MAAQGEAAVTADNRTVRLDGETVTALRRARAMSREQLADVATGPHRLSVATIKRAECGAPVYLETARRLAGLLGVDSVADLLPKDEREHVTQAPLMQAKSVGVAVVPLRSIGPDFAARVLADGLTEDLTTRLGSFWFPVISYGSLLRFRDERSGDRFEGDLGVGYWVEGSVQHSGGNLRIHVRLNDARSSRVIWAEEYSRRYTELLALQDELTNAIVGAVNRHVLDAEVSAIADRTTDDLEGFQLAARGVQFFYQYAAEANRNARALLGRAVEREPRLGHAWYLLALTYQQELLHQWGENPLDALRGLSDVAREFRRLHPTDARADVVTAYSSLYIGNREAARDCVITAIGKAPNLHTAYALLSQIQAMSGDPESGLEQIELALRLSPLGPDLWALKTVAALAHFAAEEYAQSLSWAAAAVELRPEATFPLSTIAAAAALSGDEERAKAAAERARALGSDKIASVLDVIAASTELRFKDRYMRGLALAGLAR